VTTGWTVRGSNLVRGKRLPVVQKKKSSDRLWDAPSFLFSGYGGREDHHSPSSSADVKNGWNNTSDVPICLNGVERETLSLPSPFYGE